MGTKPQFLLVTPQDAVGGLDSLGFGHGFDVVRRVLQDLVQIGDLIFAAVAYEEEEGAGGGLVGVGEEGADSFV